MQEARCNRCGGTFNPTGDEATRVDEAGEREYEHYVDDNGAECGGYGPIVAEWGAAARYAEACRRAATDQGLDPITARLDAEGIAYDVDQTGGFTMCVRVDGPDGWYAYVTDGEPAGNWTVGAYGPDYESRAGCEGVPLDRGETVTADEGVALLRRFLAAEIPTGCPYCATEGCETCAYVGWVLDVCDICGEPIFDGGVCGACEADAARRHGFRLLEGEVAP